ncbi:cation-translocating P-type ATPase [Methanocella sp. MCL-LM]|uniref:cation-translocating P-type ATPase n=1 Tax=Methanocella sp. MCL-LM TaxID=3412035 RepID=UPI003C74FFC4
MYSDKKPEEVFRELGSSHSGLTSAEAAQRLEKHGRNALAQEQKFSLLRLAIHQFTDPLIYILIIAALVTAFLQDWVDTGVILLVIFVNAVVGFFQELKAEKAVSALKSLAAPKAMVVRDGHVREIDSELVVPGDLVMLTSGTRVPADLRLVETIRLEIDESALTGESLPSRKTADKLDNPRPSPGEADNVAFMGTLSVSGRGTGVTVATGQHTQLGQISKEVATVTRSKTPLQEKLEKMSGQIGMAVLAISAVVVVLGVLTGESLYQMLLTGIALAVGAIPEGLPIVITITLAIGVKRMAERNAIVRRLPAVETLGSTTVIASDKTGTMTRNEMTVVRIYAGGRHYRLTGGGFSPQGEIIPEAGDTSNVALTSCLRAGLLANESSLEQDEATKEYKPLGDPTEVSLIVSAMKGGMEEGKEMIDYAWLDEIPFESDRMYMAGLYRSAGNGDSIAFIKGAPDKVTAMCEKVLMPDGNEAGIGREEITGVAESLGRDGLRVLAMACKRFPAGTNHFEVGMITSGCTFLGLQGMYDPPREEVHEAIKQAKRSGIRVIMVTGDHKATALSIANKLEIVSDLNAAVITGDDMERMSDEELYGQVNKVSIYSRVSPIHKLRIVRQLIKRGEVVAVTGDGVNDTPALKAAHIGVAMGKSGTDAAKETAEIIIADDNFASIFSAVKEGRVVFANIRKVVLFLLSTGLGQVILILITILLVLPLPLLPAQIIWLNLVTNGLQDVAMAFEPPEKGIEYTRPRSLKEPVISRLMIERLIVIGFVLALGTLGVFWWQLQQGASLDHARTAALTTLVLFQLFNVFNARSETKSAFRMNPLANPFLFTSIIASIIAQIALIYWAPLQGIFRTTPLAVNELLVIIPVALTVIFVVEIDKAIRWLMARRVAQKGEKAQA